MIIKILKKSGSDCKLKYFQVKLVGHDCLGKNDVLGLRQIRIKKIYK